MKTYVIGYDLNRPHQDYTALINEIKSYHLWWHYLDSTWIIKSDATAMQIATTLRQYIDANDELLVLEHRGDAAWAGFGTEASDWLKTNL